MQKEYTLDEVRGLYFEDRSGSDKNKMPLIHFVVGSDIKTREVVAVLPADGFCPFGGLITARPPEDEPAYEVETIGSTHVRYPWAINALSAVERTSMNAYLPFFNAGNEIGKIAEDADSASTIIIPTPQAANIELIVQEEVNKYAREHPGVLHSHTPCELLSREERRKLAIESNFNFGQKGSELKGQTQVLKQGARITTNGSALPFKMGIFTSTRSAVDTRKNAQQIQRAKLLADYEDVVKAIFGTTDNLSLNVAAMQSLMRCAEPMRKLMAEVPELTLEGTALFFQMIEPNRIYQMTLPRIDGPDNKPLSLRQLYELQFLRDPELTPLLAFSLQMDCWKVASRRPEASIGYTFPTMMIIGLVPVVPRVKTVSAAESTISRERALAMMEKMDAPSVVPVPNAICAPENDDQIVAQALADAEKAEKRKADAPPTEERAPKKQRKF
jgi:hypothetical protein